MNPESRIRVMIVDDHPIVRRGLTTLMGSADDIDVVGAAGDGTEALEMAEELHPDVILMDVSMPGINGMETTRLMQKACPEARVVMLTSFSGNDRVREAMRSGAVGYILKDSEPEEVLQGIRTAARAIAETEDA
jgi:DNA-binding NarL/FixJ family response regulator